MAEIRIPPLPGTTVAARWILGAAFLTYFSATALLYFLGPWHYPMPNGQWRLVAFIVAVHVAFGVGYFGGVAGTPRPAGDGLPLATVLFISVGLELALLFPTSVFNTGHWIPNPWAAADDLAAAYTDSIRLRETGRPYIHYIRIVIAPVLAVGLPLGIFYYRRIPAGIRLMFGMSVVGTIALYVSMGANAGAAHWMAIFPWFVLAGHLSGVQRLTWSGWLKAAAIQVCSLILFAVLFTATMVQRTGSFAKHGSLPGIGAELESPQPRQRGGVATRSSTKIGADGLAAYLTQGYYAVYLSLQEPFEPCYGVGNSVFLQRQVTRFTGNDWFVKCPYPVRIQDRGWQASLYWATIYPWIASDVTFPGTVIVMFAVGWLAGRVWLDILGGRNPFAVALMGQLLILLYYVPAHNKVMHSGETMVAFTVLLCLWLARRYRRRPLP